ncbi:response regulator transcription factor [Ideonella sp. DXS22W]|uniref:Response regulator transcription factor n=1 Tax=Pseudaquabacterium inlustre TaxID=2984192 RepID=A0ABU9CGQ5_9BURK
MDVLLVDDHTLLRQALALLLGTRHPGVTVHQAGTLAEALPLAAPLPDDALLLLDLGLPDAVGLQAVQALHARAPQVRLVVLSADDRPETVTAAIEAGACGFVPKTADLARLERALGLLIEGGLALPPAVVARSAPVDDPVVLTPRQLDVLRLLVEGKPNKLICRTLDLSESSVKTHLEAVYRRLGVSSRTQAVLAAARLGLLPAGA